MPGDLVQIARAEGACPSHHITPRAQAIGGVDASTNNGEDRGAISTGVEDDNDDDGDAAPLGVVLRPG